MTIINKSNLSEYRDRLKRQKEVLQLSTTFDSSEKNELDKIYSDLIEICNKRIAKNDLPTETAID